MIEVPGAPTDLISSLHDDLEQIAVIFERQLASDHSFVNALSVHVGSYRGKMLRPMMVLLCGKIGEHTPDDEVLHTLAAVVEMIHVSTLVHDDVLDEATIRRSIPTINTLHGNEMAVMLGDYLISNAYHLCASLQNPYLNDALAGVTRQLCEGEILQLSNRNNLLLTQEEYLQIIGLKTAELVAASCRLGGIIGGLEASWIDHLELFGRLLGMAFQIRDDVLDLVGEESVVGKSLGTDLVKGKMTLPIILTLGLLNTGDRDQLQEALRCGDAPFVQQVVIKHGGVELAQEHADALIARATTLLDVLPMGDCVQTLESIAALTTTRTR
jgi:octaprenyl-diphosphate synthase